MLLNLYVLYLGSANPTDWWMALESEPSLGSTTQLHMSSTLKGPEFAQGMLELDGPFTNVNKGTNFNSDWHDIISGESDDIV